MRAMIAGPFAGLYRPYGEEREIFGSRWCGPAVYEHANPALVAVYEKDPEDGDGTRVEVFCAAHPSRFYEARVAAGENSIGDPRRGYTIQSGSGLEMARLIAQLAEAIAQGMIVFSRAEEGER